MENDKINLQIMIRKKVMHELMKKICIHKGDYDNAQNHEIEKYKVEKKIDSFAKSPFKMYTFPEIQLKLENLEKIVSLEIYSEVNSMLLDSSYRPCEDCFYAHETINERIFDFVGKQYCSFHPEWPENAGQTKTNEILKCMAENWNDYYNRSKENLEMLKNYLGYKFKDNQDKSEYPILK